MFLISLPRAYESLLRFLPARGLSAIHGVAGSKKEELRTAHMPRQLSRIGAHYTAILDSSCPRTATECEKRRGLAENVNVYYLLLLHWYRRYTVYCPLSGLMEGETRIVRTLYFIYRPLLKLDTEWETCSSHTHFPLPVCSRWRQELSHTGTYPLFRSRYSVYIFIMLI
jgi:hypothetical protein